jgi:hypothetical protein
MTAKKNKSKRATGFETFNRSQQIYKLLEKGIIESEALSSSATDRPEQEDHIAKLLGSPESGSRPSAVVKPISVKRKTAGPKTQKKAKAKKPKSPKKRANRK